jgi:hypothetical protein
MKIPLTNRYRQVKISDKSTIVRLSSKRKKVRLDVDIEPVNTGIFDFTFDSTFN